MFHIVFLLFCFFLELLYLLFDAEPMLNLVRNLFVVHENDLQFFYEPFQLVFPCEYARVLLLRIVSAVLVALFLFFYVLFLLQFHNIYVLFHFQVVFVVHDVLILFHVIVI